MPRLARVVVPGLAYHVTHRGNRGEPVFFDDRDHQVYCRWLAEYARSYGMRVLAYSLMTNHVHLVVVGEKVDSLASAIGRTHMRYARRINHLRGWSGHLWGNRFYSTPLDPPHLWAAVKYVELNPVRAGIVDFATDYLWSSARAHALGLEDPLLWGMRPFPGPIEDWGKWLGAGLDAKALALVRQRTSTGRPCGSAAFVRDLEKQLGRSLTAEKRGRKAFKE